MTKKLYTYSKALQKKIDQLKSRRKKVKLNGLGFDSQLLCAPMSSTTSAPFRLLMEDLGSGGQISELISCHGTARKIKRTMDMLYVDPREKNSGIQIFGEDPQVLAQAADIAQDSSGVKFIDLNMGCPARKVFGKGSGAALMKETNKLVKCFSAIKKVLKIPFTIKMRTGIDSDHINANEIIQIAYDYGVDLVAIHGRTAKQKYTGSADWKLLEEIKSKSPLPIIGNGDLSTSAEIQKKMATSDCDAFMIGRAALRNPFIFLQALDHSHQITFTGSDYFEIILAFYQYVQEITKTPYAQSVQLRKIIGSVSSSLTHAAQFRRRIFEQTTTAEVLQITQEYFLSNTGQRL